MHLLSPFLAFIYNSLHCLLIASVGPLFSGAQLTVGMVVASQFYDRQLRILFYLPFYSTEFPPPCCPIASPVALGSTHLINISLLCPKQPLADASSSG